MIQTVTGAIAPTELGYCQIHEHLFVHDTPAAQKAPALRIDDEQKSALEARDYYAAGGRSVVDCQPVGAGRDLSALRRISMQSGVNIIGVTGYHMPMFYPKDHWIFTEDASALRARFLSELCNGVAAQDGEEPVFPGAVKAAIGADGAKGRFEVCLRAAAGAAAEAGVPLILHTEMGAGAMEAVGICSEEGLAAERVLVCHVDRQASDYAIHEAVARTGAMLDYDTIARYKYHDDASEVTLIRHMIDGGWGNRLMLSLDTTAARLSRYGGEPGLCYILNSFIDMLVDAGIPSETVFAMQTTNPQALFT